MMLKNYTIGFGLSLLLTLASFILVWLYSEGWPLPATAVAGAVVTLAVTQLLVQVVFFLHLGGSWERWNVVALLFSVLIIVFVVGGSLWIMAHLEHNMVHGNEWLNEPSPYTQHD
jgi:cytochrome o ubiquinol oxidase operon protein cyoD